MPKLRKTRSAGSSVATIAVVIFIGMLLTQAAQAKKKQPPASGPPPTATQPGPSFEATRDWIGTTLSQYDCYYSGGIRIVYANVAISSSRVLTFQSVEFMSSYKSGSKPFSRWFSCRDRTPRCINRSGRQCARWHQPRQVCQSSDWRRECG